MLKPESPPTESKSNPLFPVFLQAHRLRFVVIGGGYVAAEKLYFLLKSSPGAQVRVVASWFRPEVTELVAQYPQVQLVEKPYAQTDLAEADILLVATNDHTLNLAVYSDAKARGGLLVNVADTPHLCDFYMGSIVTKGPLKVGISTNGQSPTLAKRFRELLEAILPDDVDALAANLRELRARYKGDFEQKVAYLNQLTASMLATDPPADLGEGDENAQ